MIYSRNVGHLLEICITLSQAKKMNRTWTDGVVEVEAHGGGIHVHHGQSRPDTVRYLNCACFISHESILLFITVQLN